MVKTKTPPAIVIMSKGLKQLNTHVLYKGLQQTVVKIKIKM